jgi:eukaryotic-like serine/threonine-protein kinase
LILTDATSITDPRVGAIVQGRYRILSRLAAGGMGVVYQAERIELGRMVAIKFLHPWIAADRAFKRRFETEAKAMSRLAHPCCVSVMDFGEEEGSPFLVMDFVAGDTLRELSREGPIPPSRAIAIVRQMLAGLAHAHEQGITHRDVKPENVVVTQVVGLGDQVRILDFGVAKLRDGAANVTRGMIVGTPAYMGPEQIRGEAVDARTDLYATGVVLFELLTGHRPFEAEESSDVFRMHLKAKPPKLSANFESGRFSAELESVLARAFEKDPDRRFQSAVDFSAALERTPEGGASAIGSGGFSPASTLLSPMRAPAAPRGKALGPALSIPERARIGAAALLGRSRQLGAMLGWRARALISTRRRRIAWGVGVALLVASVGAWTWMRAVPVDSKLPPKAEAAQEREEEVPGVAEAWRLAEDGHRDAALAALSRLRRGYPKSARVAFVQGQVNFRNYRWLDGLNSYRAAIDLDPAYRSDERVIVDLIRCLDSDRFQAACAEFLYSEIGADAVPQLEHAARAHPLINVRYRAARLSSELGGSDLYAQ